MIDELLGDTAALLYGRHAAGSVAITLGERKPGRHHAHRQHAFVQHWGHDEWGCGYIGTGHPIRCAYPRHRHPTMLIEHCGELGRKGGK